MGKGTVGTFLLSSSWIIIIWVVLAIWQYFKRFLLCFTSYVCSGIALWWIGSTPWYGQNSWNSSRWITSPKICTDIILYETTSTKCKFNSYYFTIFISILSHPNILFLYLTKLPAIKISLAPKMGCLILLEVKGCSLTDAARALAKHVYRSRKGWWGDFNGSGKDMVQLGTHPPLEVTVIVYFIVASFVFRFEQEQTHIWSHWLFVTWLLLDECSSDSTIRSCFRNPCAWRLWRQMVSRWFKGTRSFLFREMIDVS